MTAVLSFEKKKSEIILNGTRFSLSSIGFWVDDAAEEKNKNFSFLGKFGKSGKRPDEHSPIVKRIFYGERCVMEWRRS